MCGCLTSVTESLVDTTGFSSKVSTVTATRQPCSTDTYNILVDLNSKVLEMFKADYNKQMMLETNSLLSNWIGNIKKSCPEEDELNIVKTFIEDEYTEFNS